eukprot:Skav203136  [mRNA]  locus=scaffold5176:37050:51053:+ [translate_table: standard]
MMQKAPPGQLFFGEDTNRILPPSLKVKEAHGIIVKMKGKGDASNSGRSEAGWRDQVEAENLSSHSHGEEMEVKQEVNKAIRLADGSEFASSRSMLPFLLSEKAMRGPIAGFGTGTASQEKFQMWFHLGFARKFRLRLHRQILLMATRLVLVLVVMDVIHMEHVQAWDPAKEEINPGLLPSHPTQRFVILLVCRWLMLTIGLAWSYFARRARGVVAVQWGLVASNLLVATLMFISYDALIYPQIHRSYTELHFLDYVNQQWLCSASADAVAQVTNTHPALFHQSLVYIPLGVVFMGVRDRTSLYISDIGRVMFLCTVVISCLLAHVLEQTERARFKTKQRVEETQEPGETGRGGGGNLMPKKVLEEIKLSPGLGKSHSYDHATIAQSDLCGFTQLASDKTRAAER